MNHPRLRFLALGVIFTLAACGSSTTTSAPAGESPATSAAPAASEPAASGPAGSPAAAGAIPEQGVDDGIHHHDVEPCSDGDPRPVAGR